MGGSGKTVLARAVALDERVRDHFQGGILWADLTYRPATEWLWDWLSLLWLDAGPCESELLLGERVRQRAAVGRPAQLAGGWGEGSAAGGHARLSHRVRVGDGSGDSVRRNDGTGGVAAPAAGAGASSTLCFKSDATRGIAWAFLVAMNAAR
ncbi:MAG: hypothetical protein JW934_02045 [Anaerolineae bacterium]|nr:hypothetical protein [Anaerolineae bacterium]